MSAKPFEPKKKVEEKKVEAPVVSQAQKEIDAVNRKVLSDSLDSAKAKRDVQIRTVDELETRIKNLQKEIDALVADHNMKARINQNLGENIQSAHVQLANLKANFDRENAKLVGAYEKKMSEVTEADSTLQKLIKEHREKLVALERDRASFENERDSNRKLVHAAESALQQNLAQWKNKEADLLAREEQLAKDKVEFEAYKDSLQPEIARITSIKNENDALMRKIELDRQNMEQIRLSSVREREAMEESKLVEQNKIASERQRIMNEDARLRKWEQDIKDSALELQARKKEVDKILYREKLMKEIGITEVTEEKSK